MMMVRTVGGSTSAFSPDVLTAAQAGIAVACIAARQVSMPSPTIRVSSAGARRTAPPPTDPPRFLPIVIEHAVLASYCVTRS